MVKSIDVTQRSAATPGDRASDQAARLMSKLLQQALIELNIDVPSDDSERMLSHLNLIARWNRVYNLTAIREPERMLVQHLFDSLAVVPELRKRMAATASQIIDVGSGAGLPGLPLALIWTQAKVHLVEPVGKKAAFLRQAAAELAAGRVEVHATRVQTLAGQLEPPDLIICRAFASLAEFVRAIEPLVAPHTLVAAMKGQRPDAEIAELPPHWSVRELLPIQVPGLQAQRHLVILGGPKSLTAANPALSRSD
jgi:16S rRNA (guanine527-N7)-methyltransferase